MYSCVSLLLSSGDSVFYIVHVIVFIYQSFFFFQAEDGIRDLVRSRGLGDVYKRQPLDRPLHGHQEAAILKSVEHERNLVVSTGTGSGLSLIHI